MLYLHSSLLCLSTNLPSLLRLCPMVFKIGPRPSREHKSILGVLGHYSLPRLVMSCYIFPESSLSVPSEVCPSDIALLSLLTLSLDSHPPTFGIH